MSGSRWAGAGAYLALLAGGVGLFVLIDAAGRGLTPPPAPPDARPVGQVKSGQVDVVFHVTATLAAVVGCGFALGRVARCVGQPPVIGEVVAGIALGPSLLGAVWPAGMHVLIPPAGLDPGGRVLAALQAVSQLGVILYMFLVGLELNAARLADRAHTTVAVSHASIVVPFVLGAALALGLYPAVSHAGVSFTSFALFLGAALAVTAFPVLARILADKGLDRTDLGATALGCAAADDVTAWCLLAFVVGVERADVGGAARVVAGSAAFVAVMLLVVRPVVGRAARRLDTIGGPPPAGVVPVAFLLVLLSALATEAIGIHAVFGAFLLGALVPHDSRAAREFAAKLHAPVTALLLPAFFAFTGLRTEVGLVTGVEGWLWVLAITATATAGKVGGTLVAARLTGQSWRDAAALGALMNTRGLMGLIVLNVGLDLGVISPTLFAMMVLMALATTAATAPALRLLGW